MHQELATTLCEMCVHERMDIYLSLSVPLFLFLCPTPPPPLSLSLCMYIYSLLMRAK